jgi:hypothetical protein
MLKPGGCGHPALLAPDSALCSLPSVAVSSAQVQSVCHSPAETRTFTKQDLLRPFQCAITTLVLTYFPLAGFQVTAFGRIWGDHRGEIALLLSSL